MLGTAKDSGSKRKKHKKKTEIGNQESAKTVCMCGDWTSAVFVWWESQKASAPKTTTIGNGSQTSADTYGDGVSGASEASGASVLKGGRVAV